MKRRTSMSILLTVTVLILVFIGLTISKSNTLFVPSRSVLIGSIDYQNPDGIIIKDRITDHDNQAFIDAIESFLLYSEPVTSEIDLAPQPDLYFMVESPRCATIICEFRLWWEGDYAIIQIRKGADWDDSLFKKSKSDTILELLESM